MSHTEPQLPQPIRIEGIEIPVADQTPLVLALLAIIQRQDREIRELRDQIDQLKGTTRRPKSAPSRLLKPMVEKPPKPDDKRPGSA